MPVKINWLGHSTFEIELPGGEVILIDPWLQGNPKYPQGHDLRRVDLMLVTHGHPDHFGDVVEVAKKFKPPVVAMYEICQWLGQQGVENLAPMNKGGTQQAAGVRVSMTHAQHSSMIDDGGRIVYAGEPAGFVVHLPDGRAFYHAGDTNLFSDMKLIRELYEPHLAMLPIGDHFTMDPRQAALACEYLHVSQVIPIHWGTFPQLTGTPQRLREELDERGWKAEVAELTPGKSWEW